MRSARFKQTLHYFLFTILWVSLTLGLGHALTFTAHAQDTLPQRPVHIRADEPLIIGAAHHAELIQQLTHTGTAQINTPQDLDQAMDGLSEILSSTLGANFLSYGALIGALNSDFVYGLKSTAQTKGLDVVIYNLYSNPSYARQITGAASASADIKTAWMQDIANIISVGTAVKQQSYNLQKQKRWKQLSKAGRQARINVIKQTNAKFPLPPLQTRRNLGSNEQNPQIKRQNFWRNFGRVNAPHPTAMQPSANSAMNSKALTLAALEILGASGGQSQAWIEGYMVSPKLNQCIKKARLNMQQCLAAGHFKYEDAFCLAQHELIETSNCLQENLF